MQLNLMVIGARDWQDYLALQTRQVEATERLATAAEKIAQSLDDAEQLKALLKDAQEHAAKIREALAAAPKAQT